MILWVFSVSSLNTGGREEKMICAFSYLSCHPKALKSLLMAFDPCVAISSLYIRKSSKVCWPFQGRYFPSDIPHLIPRKTADFSKKRVCLAYWTECSLLGGITYNQYCLFFFNEVALVLGEGFSWFYFVSVSSLNGLLPPSDGPSTSKASYLLYRGTWGWSRQGGCCCYP